MSVTSLAEGIILQSIEDLWSSEHGRESLDFFSGGEFRSCAEMAGMSLLEQVRLLKMVKEVTDYQRSNALSPAVAVSAERKVRGGYARETSCFIR
ncbi:MAG: hypothetical protein C0402_13955 [Thermodesulfovibrio sp.]|nr:hypothetical protein [Thermodesulfovibrio sp.]